METLQHEWGFSLYGFDGLDISLGRDFTDSKFQFSRHDEGHLEAQSTITTPSTDFLRSSNIQTFQHGTFPEPSDFHCSIAVDRHIFASDSETQLRSLLPPCMPDFGGISWENTSTSDPMRRLEPWQSSQPFIPLFDYDSTQIDAMQPIDQPEMPLRREIIQRPTPYASMPYFENDNANVTQNVAQDDINIHVPPATLR